MSECKASMSLQRKENENFNYTREKKSHNNAGLKDDSWTGKNSQVDSQSLIPFLLGCGPLERSTRDEVLSNSKGCVFLWRLFLRWWRLVFHLFCFGAPHYGLIGRQHVCWVQWPIFDMIYLCSCSVAKTHAIVSVCPESKKEPSQFVQLFFVSLSGPSSCLLGKQKPEPSSSMSVRSWANKSRCAGLRAPAVSICFINTAWSGYWRSVRKSSADSRVRFQQKVLH